MGARLGQLIFDRVSDIAAGRKPVSDLDQLVKDWKVAGKKLKRLDTVDKLTGKQIYAIDVKLPGMLTASMMDAPVFGAKVNSYFLREKIKESHSAFLVFIMF